MGVFVAICRVVVFYHTRTGTDDGSALASGPVRSGPVASGPAVPFSGSRLYFFKLPAQGRAIDVQHPGGPFLLLPESRVMFLAGGNWRPSAPGVARGRSQADLEVPLHQREDRMGILTGRASDCMKVAVAAAGRGTWKRSGCGGARNRAAPPPGDRAPARRHRPPGAPPPTRRGSRTRAPGGAAVREPPARGHCPDPAGGLQTLHRSARRSMTPWSGASLSPVLSRRVPSMPSFSPSRLGSSSRQPRRTSRKAALFPSPR